MFHRRLTATAALFTAGLALIPAVGHAADRGPTAAQGQAGSAALAAARSAALDTFESPAKNSRRAPQASSAASPTTGARSHAVAATGRTVYVLPRECQTDTGTGEANAPFCTVQHGVDAAKAGDTVQIQANYFPESVTIRTSGITVAAADNTGIPALDAQAGKPALTLDGVSDVTLRNLALQSDGAPALRVLNSARITMDGGVAAAWLDDAITIDGGSSDVTVSRAYARTGRWTQGKAVVRIAAGASRVTLATDVLANGSVVATGVQGLTLTGNSVQRGCSPALDLDGASTGVSVRNNLFVDSNPATNSNGGYKTDCVAKGYSWDPSVRVAADAVAGTTTDTNTFYFPPGNNTVPYGFGGTAYPTLADFKAATGQGAHDTLDTVKPGSTMVRGYGGQDLALQKGSTAIGTADPTAPGQLAVDFYGNKPRTSRGAVEYLSTDPGLAVALAVKNLGATEVEVTSTLTSRKAESAGYTLEWGDGQRTVGGLSPQVGWKDLHTYAHPGNYTITITVTPNWTGDLVTNSVDIATAGSHYTPFGPTRLLDTRNGTGAPLAKVASASSVRLKVAGQGGVPADAVAAVLNVTVTDPEQGGFVTAFPAGKARPGTSNVNFTPGRTVPNLTITPIGQNGEVELFNGSRGAVNLVADITGYFTRSFSSGYTATAPGRLADTRYGTGTAKGAVPGGGSFTVQIAGNGVGGLPATGITAVALNVTVTGPQGGGYLTAYPDGTDRPTASNLNFTGDQTVANAVIVPVGADGKIRIYNGSWGSAQVVVDVVGYYSPTGVSSYVPLNPFRWLDTRTWGKGPLYNSNGYYIYSKLGDPGDTAFALNTTVANTVAPGYLTVSPDPNQLVQYQAKNPYWPNRPLVSTLNWKQGDIVPNLVQAAPGPDGIVDFWNTSGGTVDLIVDIFGFYTV
ncbi:hypothetical protein ABT095_33320 [Kitasatospora sp. NPDC002227]|uniref:hypothetical protein n=1 Tax=Kitasatospora sp. NPDC002227 TaxID=3154773 RepID=UPI003328DC84